MKPPLKIPLLALLCVLALVAGSCKKKHRNVQGTVVDATTGEPVANAQVYFVNNGSGDSFATYNVKKMVKTDAAGHFDFGIDANTVEGMGNLYAFHPRYIAQTDGGVYTTGSEKSFTVRLQPAAYLKLHVKNVPPLTPWYIYLNISTYGNGFSSENLDTTLVLTAPGNQPLDIDYVVGRRVEGNTPQTFHGVTHMSHFDTTSYTIEY